MAPNSSKKFFVAIYPGTSINLFPMFYPNTNDPIPIILVKISSKSQNFMLLFEIIKLEHFLVEATQFRNKGKSPLP